MVHNPRSGAEEDGMSTTAQGAPVTGKTTGTTAAHVIQPAKPDVNTTRPGAKSEVHGMKSVVPHHAKANVPAKTVEPAKS